MDDVRCFSKVLGVFSKVLDIFSKGFGCFSNVLSLFQRFGSFFKVTHLNPKILEKALSYAMEPRNCGSLNDNVESSRV